MLLTPLTAPCPQCGSKDVLYSCKPECCFNHVCGNCYATFELATDRVGDTQEEIGPVPEVPDATGPTAPCARCGEWRVYAREGVAAAPAGLVCVDCRALLTLRYENVVAGSAARPRLAGPQPNGLSF